MVTTLRDSLRVVPYNHAIAVAISSSVSSAWGIAQGVTGLLVDE